MRCLRWPWGGLKSHWYYILGKKSSETLNVNTNWKTKYCPCYWFDTFYSKYQARLYWHESTFMFYFIKENNFVPCWIIIPWVLVIRKFLVYWESMSQWKLGNEKLNEQSNGNIQKRHNRNSQGQSEKKHPKVGKVPFLCNSNIDRVKVQALPWGNLSETNYIVGKQNNDSSQKWLKKVRHFFSIYHPSWFVNPCLIQS